MHKNHTCPVKLQSDEHIIAITPVHQPSMCTPGVIVIRDLGDEYVVHNAEVNENGIPINYYWGHYFKKTDINALQRAMAAFVAKCERWYETNEVGF